VPSWLSLPTIGALLDAAPAATGKAGLDVRHRVADRARAGAVDGEMHSIVAMVPSPFAKQVAGALLVLAVLDQVGKAGAEGDFGLIDFRVSGSIFLY
jgi:hypothetical protein